MNGSTQRWRGSGFLPKISCLNFSKAVRCDANPDPDPWVRIRKKIHQNRKMQMIPDPDVVRIRESYQTNCECRNFYADPRFASDPYHTVRIHSSGSDWARTSHVCKGTRHLDHPWGTGNAMPCSRTNAIRVREVPNPPSLPCLPRLPCLPLPSCGKLSLNPPGMKGHPFQSG
jgi:hypothetical protein